MARDNVVFWFSQSSLYLTMLVLFGISTVYYMTKRYLYYRADITFGARHGCQPLPQLTTRWPLGIDRIRELWTSNSEGHLLAFLCSIAKDYEPGNNLTQYLLFGPRAFHILHPKNVEAILSTNFQDYGFGVRHEVFAPLLGDGIFTQEGLAWKHSRELLRKQFVSTQYQKLDNFRVHVDNLIARLPVKGIIDLQPLFFSLTLDTTTALLFGRSVYSLKVKVANDTENVTFAESFNVALEGLAKRFRIAPWHSFYNPSKFRQACSTAHRFVEDYIDEKGLQSRTNLLSELPNGFIDQVMEESANKKEVRDQLLNVLLAGRDTTACCLSWTFRLLVRHDRVMSRLRKEVQSVMDDTECPSREQIRKMPYLASVIKESLRLYPPVPLNNRTATKTTILPTGGGPDGNSPILVKRGELVVYSQYVNSRLKSIYGPDADDFRPERWETGELANIGWAYFPFSGGPRACLGQDFALMEVSYTVVRLLQSCFTIALPEDEKIAPVGAEKQRLTLVLLSADGCAVKVERAEKKSQA